jgi:hypothetical protein
MCEGIAKVTLFPSTVPVTEMRWQGRIFRNKVFGLLAILFASHVSRAKAVTQRRP